MRVEVLGQIIHLNFETEEELMLTLLRFQEHYESPEFAGEIFTLGQYRQWYTEQCGSFSYGQDWGGCNFPDYIVEPFAEGLFDPLTKEEEVVLNILRYIEKPFYVIGTPGGKEKCPETYWHEYAHAMFYLDKDYRRSVLRTINGAKLDSVKRYLLKSKYSEDVWRDEANAYLTCSAEHMENAKYSDKVRKSLIKKLIAVAPESKSYLEGQKSPSPKTA